MDKSLSQNMSQLEELCRVFAWFLVMSGNPYPFVNVGSLNFIIFTIRNFNQNIVGHSMLKTIYEDQLILLLNVIFIGFIYWH